MNHKSIESAYKFPENLKRLLNITLEFRIKVRVTPVADMEFAELIQCLPLISSGNYIFFNADLVCFGFHLKI